MTRAQKTPHHPAPVRVMVAEELAAVVTNHHGEINIRPEPGWRLTKATISVTMTRTRQPRTKTVLDLAEQWAKLDPAL